MADKRDIFAVIPREEAFNIVKKFKEHLIKIGVPVSQIYIYGSYASGKPHYGSDIDVCVLSDTFKDKLESDLLLRHEAIKIDSRIETVAYSNETFEDWIPLVWEIKQKGISIN